jgi:hypothetical protein
MDFDCGVATYSEFRGACSSGIIPSLEILVLPAHQNSPVLDYTRLQNIASDFQPRLLGYRIANCIKVCNSR